MNFVSYIVRQKNIIRRRHAGETYLVEGGEARLISGRDRLLRELDDMRGLNKSERLSARRGVGA